MSKAWSKGSTRQWRAVRAMVLETNRVQNGGRCRARVVGVCSRYASHAHHTLGRNITGDDPRYIVAVCGPCNQHIGDPQTHPRECKACVNVNFGPKMERLKPTILTKW